MGMYVCVIGNIMVEPRDKYVTSCGIYDVPKNFHPL